MTGGLGRIVAALPALQAADSLVITNGWEELYSLTTLRTIEANSAYIGEALKGLDIVTPEPYHQADYREGKYNLVQGFHKCLGTEGNYYGLVPDTKTTEAWAKFLCKEALGKPIAMIQLKSGATNRDMSQGNAENVIEALKAKGYFPVIIGDLDISFDMTEFHIKDTSITDYVSLIALCDLFIGCDSSGMHIAKAFNKKGIIFFTSTAGQCFYPENFIGYKHPNHPNTVEYPRLFKAEQVQATLNRAKGLSNYTVPVDYLVDAIETLEDIKGNPESNDE
jgi:hypothetical protein